MVQDGTAVVWVKVPSDIAESNDLLLLFGNDDIDTSEPSTNLWPSRYQAVYHFAGDLGDDVVDSTTNTASGILVGSVARIDDQFGPALDFGGTEGSGGQLCGLWRCGCVRTQ